MVLPGHLFGSLPGLRELEWVTCPEGLARRRWVRQVIDLFLTLRRAPGLRLVDLIQRPSPALISALAHVAGEVEALESYRMELEMKKAKTKQGKSAPPPRGGNR